MAIAGCTRAVAAGRLKNNHKKVYACVEIWLDAVATEKKQRPSVYEIKAPDVGY